MDDLSDKGNRFQHFVIRPRCVQGELAACRGRVSQKAIIITTIIITIIIHSPPVCSIAL
ncbi:hypothetical protein NQZ68_002961 [Dissostichus eleginoides]|nr:hypothetical protein NQZ68_002961 [Dissostichus eleginoides]